MRFEGYNLNLCGKEPSASEVLEEIYKKFKEKPAEEVVFCGYGEPTMRLEVLLEVGRTLKRKIKDGSLPHFALRLNTIGLGNLVHGRDITADLSGVLDKINISLNAPQKEEWLALVRPHQKYADKGFEAVLDFIRLCSGKIDKVVVSVVDKQNVNIEETKKLVKSLGAELYVREYL
jgi:radical SAM protein, TatD family-associated